MSEKVAALELRELDGLLAELEREFSAQDVPTLLRLRAAMLTEELFSALQALEDGSGMLRCTFPAPRTALLQYRNRRGALKPDLRMMARLAKNPCAEGVQVTFREGSCTLTADGAAPAV